ncbi:YIP1 family protein [Actinomyces vulturis]|uniref:YIP1 family protein n=1 Tax=Actinomyces vulturis TaxID=1857645 RepID=UPI00082E132A|nr:YIP1 family protein [Actinomyces vulturis]
MAPSDASMNESTPTNSQPTPMAPPPPPPAPMPSAASASQPQQTQAMPAAAQSALQHPAQTSGFPQAAPSAPEGAVSAQSTNTYSFSTLPQAAPAPLAPSTASTAPDGTVIDPNQQPQYVVIPAQPNPFVLGMKSVWESVKAMWKGGPVAAAQVAETNKFHTWLSSAILALAVAFVSVITFSMMVNGATNASLSLVSQAVGGDKVNENWVDGGAAIASWFIIIIAVFVMITGRALITWAVMKIRGSQFGYRHALSAVAVALIPSMVLAVIFIIPSFFAGTLVGVMLFLPLLQFSIPCLFIATEIGIYVLTARACPNRSVYVPYTLMLPVWLIMAMLIMFTTMLMLAS